MSDIMFWAREFLEKIHYQYLCIQHSDNCHEISHNCDQIIDQTDDKMVWCENKCILWKKTFTPISLKQMAAFSYMLTQKFNSINISFQTSSEVINYLKSQCIMKPFNQMCYCQKCSRKSWKQLFLFKPLTLSEEYLYPIIPHTCTICLYHTFYNRLINRNHQIITRKTMRKIKWHIEQINHLIFIGKYTNVSKLYDPPNLGYVDGIPWSDHKTWIYHSPNKYIIWKKQK